MTTFELTRARVLDLKSRLNPATGEGYTHLEIAGVLGFASAQALQYYIKDVRKGRCPCCLRKLKVDKKPEPTNQPTQTTNTKGRKKYEHSQITQ